MYILQVGTRIQTVVWILLHTSMQEKCCHVFLAPVRCASVWGRECLSMRERVSLSTSSTNVSTPSRDKWKRTPEGEWRRWLRVVRIISYAIWNRKTSFSSICQCPGGVVDCKNSVYIPRATTCLRLYYFGRWYTISILYILYSQANANA